jgi:hypothetical protein
MVKEAEILKICFINTFKGFIFSCSWVRERSKVTKLAKSRYFKGWHRPTCIMLRIMGLCGEQLQVVDF